MSLQKLINDTFDEKAKSFYVAFIAQILSVSGNKAKIQPLGLTKQYGGTAQKQSVISGVHIASSALCRLKTEEIEYVTDVDFLGFLPKKEKRTICVATPIKEGDLVLCVCCDRNIDAALKGKNELPPVGCHNKSDCVIVAII